MKPLALIERAITNATEPGQLVVDPFLGSGTAIIAAERTGRTCYGMDLDARYCDVILARWEAETGESACGPGSRGGSGLQMSAGSGAEVGETNEAQRRSRRWHKLAAILKTAPGPARAQQGPQAGPAPPRARSPRRTTGAAGSGRWRWPASSPRPRSPRWWGSPSGRWSGTWPWCAGGCDGHLRREGRLEEAVLEAAAQVQATSTEVARHAWQEFLQAPKGSPARARFLRTVLDLQADQIRLLQSLGIVRRVPDELVIDNPGILMEREMRKLSPAQAQEAIDFLEAVQTGALREELEKESGSAGAGGRGAA